MSLAVILCPWVAPMAPFGQEFSPQLLSQVNFEFETSASLAEMQVATAMRARLALASGPLAARGFSVQLPVRSDRRMRDLWDGLVGQSTGRPQVPMLGEQAPNLILALLTRRSISTLIESTALAVTGSVPLVCIGIDIPVPELLDAFWRVSSVEPSADDSLFVQIVDAACRQNPQGQPAGFPSPSH